MADKNSIKQTIAELRKVAHRMRLADKAKGYTEMSSDLKDCWREIIRLMAMEAAAPQAA